MRTVSEQLMYEMGDSRSYLTPDVTADFASIRLEQAGRNRVRVWGVTGRPAPGSLKVSAAYSDGWKASGSLSNRSRSAKRLNAVGAGTSRSTVSVGVRLSVAQREMRATS